MCCRRLTQPPTSTRSSRLPGAPINHPVSPAARARTHTRAHELCRQSRNTTATCVHSAAKQVNNARSPGWRWVGACRENGGWEPRTCSGAVSLLAADGQNPLQAFLCLRVSWFVSGLWCFIGPTHCFRCPSPVWRRGEKGKKRSQPENVPSVSPHLCGCATCLQHFNSIFFSFSLCMHIFAICRKPAHSDPWTEPVCTLAAGTHYSKASPFSPKNVNKTCGFG